MGSAKYSLRWNNHQTHLLNAFEGLLHNETLVDVTLVCQETTFKAHKVVLSACRYVNQIFYFGTWLPLPLPEWRFIISWEEPRINLTHTSPVLFLSALSFPPPPPFSSHIFRLWGFLRRKWVGGVWGIFLIVALPGILFFFPLFRNSNFQKALCRALVFRIRPIKANFF